MTFDRSNVAECHRCDREVSLDSEEFEENWVKTVNHSKNNVQRNQVLCPDCQEYRFTGQNIVETAFVFVDSTIGKVDRKLQSFLGGSNA